MRNRPCRARPGWLAAAALALYAPAWAAAPATAAAPSVVYQYQAAGGGGGGANVKGNGPVGVALAADGTVLAATFAGGPSGIGVITRIAPGNRVTTLELFTLLNPDPNATVFVDTGSPQGRLLPLPDGSVVGAFGTGFSGGGLVFRVAADGKSARVLRAFTCRDCTSRTERNTAGYDPIGDLLLGADGAVYGATRSGGPSGSGVIYRLTLGGAFSVLHAFGPDTGPPTGSLLQARDGALLGTTAGGAFDAYVTAKPPTVPGTIFRRAPSGTFSVLHAFTTGGGSAFGPTGGLTPARNGFLYGLSTYGGAFGLGAVYRLAPDGTGFRTVASFTGTNGATPYKTALTEAAGALWGTATMGGVPGGGEGALVRVDETSGALRTAYAFSGNSQIFTTRVGAAPSGTLALRRDGTLLGATETDDFAVATFQPQGGAIFGYQP